MPKSFKEGDSVNTCWGVGYVEAVRASDYVVKLKCWQLAQGQSPTLCLQEEALRRVPQNIYPGTEVKTFVGPCKVVKVRVDDTYVCTPTVWHLAEYSPSIFLYLNADSIQQTGFNKL